MRSLLILFGSSTAQLASLTLGILGDAPSLEELRARLVRRALLDILFLLSAGGIGIATKNGAQRVRRWKERWHSGWFPMLFVSS